MGRARYGAFLWLFAGSGAAALIYQVAWMRELGLLFGNTTHAAASTLSIFFLGLALGGAWFGRHAARLQDPVRTFAWLELGVALAAGLPLFGLLPLYRSLYAPLYEAVGTNAVVFSTSKLVLAAVFLLPASVLMGGTLPVLGQALLADRGRMGRRGGWLYAVNTVGAAGGALAAAFVLPQALGYRGTYAVALATSVFVGLCALLLGRFGAGHGVRPAATAEAARAPLQTGLVVLAFGSGALALGLEVLWTRAFAQVLQNSVYTFGAILVVFLLALAVGGGLAGLLASLRVRPRRVLGVVLSLAGVLVVLGPRVFAWVSRNMRTLEGIHDYADYLVAVFLGLGLVLFLPVAILGIVLPFLLRLAAEGHETDADTGAVLGRLLAWNTVGALVGALLAGFVLAALVGPWVSIVLIGSAYLIAGALVVRREQPVLGLVLLLLLVPVGFEAHVQRAAGRERMVPRAKDGRATETLLAVYEGAAGTTSVTRRVSGSRVTKLRFNRYYTLGSSGDPRWDRMQAHLPLLIHPSAKSVFFIGMGTGVTAGGALVHEVDRVLVTELVPEVVVAARDHFALSTNGLFTDERVTLLAEDARTVLRGTDERYDVIVGDLFLPWKRGVGSLFTVEQLEAGRDRLTSRGVYAQWLPMYQLSEADFACIAQTFQSVFPRVTIWRGDFFAERPILALVGHADRRPLDASGFQERVEAFTARGLFGFETGAASIGFQLYVGDLEMGVRLLPTVPINTDDQPWLEFETPRRQIARASGNERPFVGRTLQRFFEQLQGRRAPQKDGYLSRADDAQRGYVSGGRYLFAYAVARNDKRKDAREAAFEAWTALVPEDVRPRIKDWVR